jgi:HSP20 family protein
MEEAMSEEQTITKAESNPPERVSKRPVVTPAVDIFENNDELLVIADVPGASSEGLDIHFDKDQLFINASVEPFGEGHAPLFREFTAVDYRRIFELAPGIDAEKITADLKNGVLAIHLPKSAALKPRRIQISAE